MSLSLEYFEHRTRWEVIAFQLRQRLNAIRKAAIDGRRINDKRYGIDWKAIGDFIGKPPNDGHQYQLDHIKPVASFDLTNPDEAKAAFAPENHQWLSKEDHRKKTRKDRQIIEEYAEKEMARFQTGATFPPSSDQPALPLFNR